MRGEVSGIPASVEGLLRLMARGMASLHCGKPSSA